MVKAGWVTLCAVLTASVAACETTDLPTPNTFPGLPSPGGSPGSGSTTIGPFRPSGDLEFDAWRSDFASRAVAAGHAPAVVHATLDGVAPLSAALVASLGEDQAEFVKPIWDYVKSATTPARVSKGREKMAAGAAMFDRIEAAYAPPREILSAIWGMETSYGGFMGNSDAVQQLATLAYKGKRTKFGETQLLAVFDLLETGVFTREQLKRASWAGAVGQTQFMPATFLQFGRDGDGDNRKDPWDSSADALASAANYLAQSGWKKGEPWAVEAILPAGFDYALADGSKRSVAQWKLTGLAIAHDRPAGDVLQAELFAPAGAHGPAFLLFENFYVIRTYNNADSYALSIGLLADMLAGRPDLFHPWPTDLKVLTKSQVMELQAALKKLGFDAGPVDGMPGRQTRSAVQAFQKTRNMVADGYPTEELLAQVLAAAG